MPIFDQGYQHWSGELMGHTWRWYAIARHGVRIGMKNWFLRIYILFAWVPAIGLAFMLSVWGLVEQKSTMVQFMKPLLMGFLGPEIVADPIAHRTEVWTIFYDFFLRTVMRYSMVLVVIVGPSLISQDLRFNALPLYFSRPLRRIDYFLGKLGVITWFLMMVLIFPSLIAYGLGLLFSRDLSIVPDTLPMLLRIIAFGAIVCLSAGLLILALSSLSRNSRYIALAWMAVWGVSALAGEAVEGMHDAHQHQRRAQRSYEMHMAQHRVPAGTPAERAKLLQEQRAAMEKIEADERAEAERDWSPMLSYSANIMRLRRELIGTDAAWRRLADKQAPQQRADTLHERLGPQYPWYWSAAVLVFLFGLSACILNFRVKSLDRLK